MVKDQPPSTLRESDDLASKVEPVQGSTKDSEDKTPIGEPCHCTKEQKDVEMVSSSVPSDKNELQQSASTNTGPTVVSKDVNMTSESLPLENNEPQQPVPSEPVASEFTDASKDVAMVSESLPSEKNDTQQPITANSIVENGTSEDKKEKSEDKEDKIEKSKDNKDEKEKIDSMQKKDDQNIEKVKCAAVTALSAAAVKAKLLANQEEELIRELAASLIEKQLHKLETKLGFFNEMDNVIMRVREQMDRSRQKLYHERAQIIAARLGLPASSSRAMPPSLPTNRIATNFANSVPRPPMSMTAQRPPLSRPMGTMTPAPHPLTSTAVAGGSIRPSSQDKVSSVGTK